MAIEITSLAVNIDPRGAEQGAQKALQAANRMAAGMVNDLNRVEKKSQEASNQVGQAGQKMNAGLRHGVGGIAGMVTDALGALGLLNNGFGRMVYGAQSMGRVASQATQTLFGMGAGATMATGGIRALFVALGPLLPLLIGLTAALGAAALAVYALGAAFSFIKGGFDFAAKFETATVSLSVLLGSTKEAKKRMEEIRQFAAKTPFESPELIEASRTLQVFTGGALAGAKGLTLIGDTAKGVNQPIQDVAMWVGRLYSGLKGGQPVGEATMRLLEMGAIAPALKGKIDQLATSANEGGKNFAQIWALAESSLLRYKGTMALTANTWEGLMSTARDNWHALQMAVATPIMDALKPLLQNLGVLMDKLTPQAEAVGQAIGTALQQLTGLYMSDQLGNAAAALFEGMGNSLWIAFQTAIAKALIWLTENISKPWATWLNQLENGIHKIVNWMLDQIDKAIAKLAALNPIASEPGSPIDRFENWLGSKMVPIDNITPWTVGNVQGLGTNGRAEVQTNAQIQKDVDSATSGVANFFQGAIDVLAGQDPYAKLNALREKGLQVYEKQFGAAQTTVETMNRTAQSTAGAANAAADLANNLERAGESAGRAAENASIYGDGLGQVNSRGNINSGGGPLIPEWFWKPKTSGLQSGGVTGFLEAQTAHARDYADAVKRWGEYQRALSNSTEATWQYAQAQKRAQELLVQSTIDARRAAENMGLKTKGQYTSYVTAATFHSGGMASSERPAVLESGESVLTAEATADIKQRLRGTGKASGGGVTVINVTSKGEMLEALAANPGAFLNIISRNASQIRSIIGG